MELHDLMLVFCVCKEPIAHTYILICTLNFSSTTVIELKKNGVDEHVFVCFFK